MKNGQRHCSTVGSQSVIHCFDSREQVPIVMGKAHEQEKAPNGKHGAYILGMFKQRKGKGQRGNSNGYLQRLCGNTPSGLHHGVARHSVIWTCCAGWARGRAIRGAGATRFQTGISNAQRGETHLDSAHIAYESRPGGRNCRQNASNAANAKTDIEGRRMSYSGYTLCHLSPGRRRWG